MEENIRLPITDNHYNAVKSFVEDTPIAEYHHASHDAYERFRDIKFGIRIHWGLYSIWALQGESWPFLWFLRWRKQRYQELYKSWNPTGFNAEEWMRFFEKVGFRCFAFTTKHHEGFSMFDTKTRVIRRVHWTGWKGPRIEDCNVAYSIMETPFHRDIVKELCDAAHQHNIHIDLYFSHPDWYDADFRPYGRHPLTMNDVRIHPEKYNEQFQRRAVRVPVPTAEEMQHMVERHRAQLVELLSNYGQIDMICLDNWLGSAVWPQVRETLLKLRQIQPDVMFRARGIGNYGDYYTPEGFVPEKPGNTNMPWMVIHPLGKTFSYDPKAKRYKGAKWVIHQLIDTASKGGNFMVGIGPDKNGKFHPEAIKQLEAVGQWLRVNGDGIYSTRMWTHWKEGEHIRFTCSKDQRSVFLFTLERPGTVITSTLLRPKIDTPIYMLGIKEPLKWEFLENELQIHVPDSIVINLPCNVAWGFQIEI